MKLQAIRLGLAVRFGRRPEGLTLAEYFRRCGQGEAARRLLWDPLALAILNEPVGARGGGPLPPRLPGGLPPRPPGLAPRLPAPRAGASLARARRRATSRGAAASCGAGARVEGLVVEDGRVAGVRYAQRAGDARGGGGRPRRPRRGSSAADAVVSRGPGPRRSPALLPEEWRARPPFAALARFGGSPIVSVEMWLDRVVVDRPMLGLRDSEMEWVFDKGRLYGREGAPQHLAFIVSAAYRSAAKTNAELVAAAEGALRRYFPAMAEARGRALARAARAAGDLRVEPRARGAPPGAGHADRGPLPRRRLDRHRPARHDRGRRAQRAASGAARARVPDDRGAAGARERPLLPAPALGRRGLPRRCTCRPTPLAYGLANFLFLCNLVGDPGRRSACGRAAGCSLSSQAVAILLDRHGVDARTSRRRLLTGRHLIGGTDYMWDPQWPLFTRLLLAATTWRCRSCSCFALRRIGYDRRGLPGCSRRIVGRGGRRSGRLFGSRREHATTPTWSRSSSAPGAAR